MLLLLMPIMPNGVIFITETNKTSLIIFDIWPIPKLYSWSDYHSFSVLTVFIGGGTDFYVEVHTVIRLT